MYVSLHPTCKHHSSKTLWSCVLFTIPSCMCPRGFVYWWVVCEVITHYFQRGQGNMLSSRSSVSEVVSESAGLEWGRTGVTITALLCSASLRLRSCVPSICWMAWMNAKTYGFDLDSNATIRAHKKIHSIVNGKLCNKLRNSLLSQPVQFIFILSNMMAGKKNENIAIYPQYTNIATTNSKPAAKTNW